MAKRLYVGNLPYRTTEEALQAAFAAEGREVVEVAIATDRNTGRSRGFAFVEMGSEQDAEAAITAWDGREFEGRSLKVSVARERTARPPRRDDGSRGRPRRSPGPGRGDGGGGDRGGRW